MATNPHTHDELGSLTIGGAEIVCALENVGWDHSTDTVDVRGACRFGALNQPVKDQATLTAKALGSAAAGYATSHMHLTTLTLGGVSIVPVFYRINFQGAFDKQALPAAGVLGKAEGVVGKGYTGSVDLVLDDSEVAQDIVIACESRDLTDREMVLSLVVNGKTLTLPVLLSGNAQTSAQGDYQKVTVNFMGQAPAAPAPYPTVPAALPGSPTLLDWALVTPKANLAFSFVSRDTHGIARTGNLTWDGFNLTIADGEVVDYTYTWKTYGDWTTEATVDA